MSISASAKEGKESSSSSVASASVSRPSVFQWSEHSKLSWEDFQGPVEAISDESAAATHCGIGFSTKGMGTTNPEVIVYNRFYTGKSWVKNDARIPQILEHEQGHFDLCELYTRKLRTQLAHFDFSTPNVGKELYKIYESVNAEYEEMQQRYEETTAHGTVIPEQKRWQQYLASSLASN